MANNSIIIVTLVNNEADKILKEVCGEISKFYLCISDLIDYQIISKKSVIDKCGIKYLKKLEQNAILDSLEYENTIILFTFSQFYSNKKIYQNDKLKKIYLKYDYNFVVDQNKEIEDITNEIVFNERNKMLIDSCDYVVNVNNPDFNDIKKYLKGE